MKNLAIIRDINESKLYGWLDTSKTWKPLNQSKLSDVQIGHKGRMYIINSQNKTILQQA